MNDNQLTVLLLLLSGSFLYLAFYQPDVSILSFDNSRITYTSCSIQPADRGSRKLVLHSSRGELFLYAHNGLFPQNMTLEEARKLLHQSNTATVWLEPGTNFIRGIQTATFSIQPEQGVKWVNEERKGWIVIILGCFVGAIGHYIYCIKVRGFSWWLMPTPRTSDKEPRH